MFETVTMKTLQVIAMTLQVAAEVESTVPAYPPLAMAMSSTTADDLALLLSITVGVGIHWMETPIASASLRDTGRAQSHSVNVSIFSELSKSTATLSRANLHQLALVFSFNSNSTSLQLLY